MAGFEQFFPKLVLPKVLVVVGSGSFDQLIEAASCSLVDDFHLVCQIGHGKFSPDGAHFRFNDDYRSFFAQADVIITHGGAGTVFELLEMYKKMVVVPNQFRLDKHQSDLANYVEKQHFAKVCWDLADLAEDVKACIAADFVPYHKDDFFMADDVLKFLGGSDR